MQDGQPDRDRGVAARLVRGDQLWHEVRPRHRAGDFRDFEGRGPVLADGESLEDDERAEVRRLRLRGRLDAQRPRHLFGRSQTQRRAAPVHGAYRSVLRASASARRWALGYLVVVESAGEGLRWLRIAVLKLRGLRRIGCWGPGFRCAPSGLHAGYKAGYELERVRSSALGGGRSRDVARMEAEGRNP